MPAPEHETASGLANEELPEGWTIPALGDVASPSKEKVEPRDRPNVPYLSLEHIEAHTTRILGQGVSGDVKSTKTAFRPGDVLYGKLRPYLNKVAVPDFDGICSTDILVFPKNRWLDSRFLMWFLSLPQVVEFANHYSAGMELPRISFKTLGTLDFPLPPLAEQRRIVAAVERLFEQLWGVRERLEKVPAILKRFRQSVLAAACSGRLTEDWRESHGRADRTADLVKAILGHRRKYWEEVQVRKLRAKGSTPKDSKWRLRYEEPEAWETEYLEQRPEGWSWLNLRLLGQDPLGPVQTGPFGAQLHNDEFTEAGTPVIAVGNLTGMGFTTEGLYFITREKADQLSRYDIQAGDVLFARSGATLGKVCVAPSFVKDWRMTGHILRGRLNPRFILPEFAVYALHGDPVVRDQVHTSIRGITRPGFNTALLESIRLPVAPILEQHEIVRRVEALFQLADDIEARVAAATARADKLQQAILAKAFRGELVPTEATLALEEGRTYEPASKLLDRIKEREDGSRHDKRGRRTRK